MCRLLNAIFKLDMKSDADHLSGVQADAQVTHAQALQLLDVHSRYLCCTSRLNHERLDLLSQLSRNLHVASMGMHCSFKRSQSAANDVVQKMRCNLHGFIDAFVTMMREWMVDVLRPFQVTIDISLLWHTLKYVLIDVYCYLCTAIELSWPSGLGR